jgi:hypothetical protein
MKESGRLVADCFGCIGHEYAGLIIVFGARRGREVSCFVQGGDSAISVMLQMKEIGLLKTAYPAVACAGDLVGSFCIFKKATFRLPIRRRLTAEKQRQPDQLASGKVA